MRNHPFLKIYIGMTLFLLCAAIGLFFFWRQSLNPPLTASQQQFQRERRQQTIDRVVAEYEQSSLRLLNVGDTFPVLEYPVLAGHAPDWKKPSFITIGSVIPTSNPAKLHKRLQNDAIQHIHISTYQANRALLEQWPEDVIILDATDDGSAPRALLAPVGLYRAASYFIDAQKIVLRKLHYTLPVEYITDSINVYMREGALPDTYRALPNLPLQQPLPLDVLPDDMEQAIRREMEKPITLVFLDEKPFCAMCRRDFLVHGTSFLEKWRRAGYGLVLVEGGYDAFSVQQQDDGILHVTDIGKLVDPKGYALMNTWGDVLAGKFTLVLRNGVVEGLMPWREIFVEGTAMKDIHFAALDAVITRLRASTPSLQE